MASSADRREVMVDPQTVDVRLALGTPHGNEALRMTCPAYIHQARIGQEDSKQSLAVYRDNLQCYGCGWHVSRRYAALAFVLGYWDGLTGEHAGVLRAKERLAEFTSNRPAPSNPVREPYVPGIDPYAADAFHMFLLSHHMRDRLAWLQWSRGWTLDTIKKYRVGHSGTHFTFPVHDLSGALVTIRYRLDEKYGDINAPDSRKYEGTWGRNQPVLYPLHVLSGITRLRELWLVEGEADSISGNQAGDITLTVTNGSGQVPRMFEMICAKLPRLIVGRYVIATDADGAGNEAAYRLATVLCECGQSVVRARWSGAKDLTEFYAAGNSRGKIWYEAA